MIKHYSKKILIILLLCSGSQQIQAVDWATAFVGVVLTLCGLASDDQQQEQKNNKQPRQTSHTQQRQNTSNPTQTHRPQPMRAQQRPNKQQLFDSLEKKLQEIAGINEQSAFIQEGLWKKKQEVVTNTLKQNFATHAQAEQYAFEHLPGGIREFFVTKVIENAQGKIASSRKEQDLKKIEEYFGHQIDQKLSIKKPVTDLFKNLNHDVDSYIQKYVNNQRTVTTPQRSAVTHDYTPSAPRIEELNRPVNTPNLYPDIREIQTQAKPAIEEILPKGENNIESLRNKTVHKQIYVNAECSVCQENFAELKKRATLRCGHQLCPNCLHNWIFTKIRQGQKPTCPECRHPIDPKDYNSEYISSKL